MKSQHFLFAVLCLLVLIVAPTAAQDKFRLPVGETLEREIAGAETHYYKISLKKDEFFQIRVEQKGIDVVLKLIDASGKTLATIDSPNGSQGPEVLKFVTDADDDYTLEVNSLDQKAKKGNYSIQRTETRPAAANDRKAIEADQALREAERLSSQPTIENFKIASTKLEQARKLYLEIGDKSNEAQSLISLGKIKSLLGDKQKAGEFFDEALSLYKSAGDKNGEATALNDLGVFCRLRGDKQKALDYYNRALPLSREIKDKINEAVILNGIALVHSLAGENRKALEYFDQALPLVREIRNKNGEMAILNGIAGVFKAMGEKQKALEYYKQALPISREIGDIRGEGIILAGLGNTYSLMGNQQTALNYLRQALSKLQTVGDIISEAAALSSIGKVFYSLDDLEQALFYHNKALSIQRAFRDKDGVANTLNELGSVYGSLGEMRKALEYFNEAISLFQAAGNKKGETMVLNNIGGVYRHLGETQTALDKYNLALPISQAIGDPLGESAILNNIGTVLASLGQIDKALEYYKQALAKLETIRDAGGEARTLYNIGAMYRSSKNNQQALEYFNKALLRFKTIGSRNGEATTLTGIGSIYSALGDKRKALDYFSQTLPLFKAVNNKTGEAIALHNSMVAWRSLNKPRLAVFYGKQSVNVFQQLRGKSQSLEDSQLQISFLKSVEYSYRELAELLIEQRRLDEAVQVLNSFKDQEYFDANSVTRRQYMPLTLTKRESEFELLYRQKSDHVGTTGREVEELKLKIGARQPTADEVNQPKQLEANFDAASTEFSALLKQAETEYTKGPDEKDKVEGIPDTKEMQNALRDLQSQTGKKAACVYTLVGEDKFSAVIVSPDDIVFVFSPVKDKVLKQKAVGFLAQISDVDNQTNMPKSSQIDVQKSGHELYEIIFAQIAIKLKELKFKPDVLMWSLDGALRYIPVSALYDGKLYLAERYQNVVFTRANAKRMLASGSPKWTGLGFYNSKEYSLPVNGKLTGFRGLKNAKSEVETIFGFPSKPGIIAGEFVSNEKFTKDSMLKALKLNRPLIHIASHFRFEAGDSNSSFLLLGDGSKLTLEDIKNERNDLFNGVELLTLSACETGVQKEREYDGREIDGFAELAQRKGAGAVIASLWKVDDESTSQLMTQFYQTREAYKITKVEALQRAQLSLLKSKNYSHPYYWSPFILMGNWR